MMIINTTNTMVINMMMINTMIIKMLTRFYLKGRTKLERGGRDILTQLLEEAEKDGYGMGNTIGL